VFIHSTIHTDTNSPFSLISEWTIDYFRLANGDMIDSNDDSVKFDSLKDDNCYEPLCELDLSYVYLHWIVIVSEIDDEYQLDPMKLGKINTGANNSCKIWFSDAISHWIRCRILSIVSVSFWVSSTSNPMRASQNLQKRCLLSS
jgi:hypothetical protein